MSGGSAQTIKSLKALASEPRLRILELLKDHPCNVSEIAEELAMPLSTAHLHITILEQAGLLLTEQKPATRGSQKVCARAYNVITLQFGSSMPDLQEVLELAMPIGAYVDCQVIPTCGLVSNTAIIGLLDDPASFYEPERLEAQLLWFHQGYVEYRFPYRIPAGKRLDSLHLSFEVCSEAPLHHGTWPSDLTVWVNGVEVGNWTSPADFGGQRGQLTPAWWRSHDTQYGLLKVWQVNGEGSLVDGIKISNVRLQDLQIGGNYLPIRIGVKEDARHIGGVNLFGSTFGNYPQDIVLRLIFKSLP